MRLIFAALMAFSAVEAWSQESPPPREANSPFAHVRGVVTDVDGKPVPEADVYLATVGAASKVNIQATRADAAGRWSFELSEEPRLDVVVIGLKQGRGFGVAKKENRSLFDPAQQIRLGDTIDLTIQLDATTRRTLRVIDEQGAPVAGARVGISGIGSPESSIYFYWNEALLDALTWETAANGQVSLDHLLPGHRIFLKVETPNHGTQRLEMKNAETVEEGAYLQLLPVCRVEIAVSATDVSAVKGQNITVSGRPLPDKEQIEQQKPTSVRPWGGDSRATTDGMGRATAVVPAGRVTARFEPRPDASLFPEGTPAVDGKPGETVTLAVRFKPGVKLTGLARTVDGDPVAGVILQINGTDIRTGADGTFVSFVPAEQPVHAQIRDLPIEFAFPFDRQIYLPAPKRGEKTATERELPPILLRKASPISGRVVDDSGQPVSGARVSASWVQQQETEAIFTLKSDAAVSDERGHFKLGRVFPDVDVIVTADAGDECVREATAVHSSTSHELQLTVTPEGLVPISGLVKDTDESPVTNATVKVARSMLAPGGHNYGQRPVEWNGRPDFSVQLDGRFLSPGKVPRYQKYSLTISAPGYLTRETPFLSPPPDGEVLDAGVIELTKTRAVMGLVRDSSGKPVAGAEVWSWAAPSQSGRSILERATATTDAAGRFTLEKLHPAAALALVNRDGYRLTGFGLLKDQTEMSVVLYRSDEPLPADQTVRAGKLEDARRRASAELLLNAMLPEQRSSNYFYRELLSMLARQSPLAAQAELPNAKSADSRARLLAELGAIDDALAEAESISEPYSRAFCRFALADAFKDANQIRDLLSSALLDAQAIPLPERRVVVVANVVERFAGLGDHERVAAILREELPRAEALSKSDWPGFARGYFAAQLARIDPQTALRMASEAPPDDQTRHYQNIAHVMAAANPELAEEALRRIGEHRYVDDPAVRVAYRMASVDVARAIRLVEQIDVQRRAIERVRGLGVIAMAIRETDPQRSREILQRAWSEMPPQRGGGGSEADSAFGAGIELLGYAGEIAPERLTEYFWRAVSLYPGPTGGAWSPEMAPRTDAERQARMALLLATYGVMPELQQQIMEPVFAYWESQIGTESSRFTDHRGSFLAMALVDPPRATDWAVRFHAKLAAEQRRYIPQPWEVIGRGLTADRSTLSQFITREVFHHWVIDRFDL